MSKEEIIAEIARLECELNQCDNYDNIAWLESNIMDLQAML